MSTLKRLIRPLAKQFIYRAVAPSPALRPLYRGLFEGHWYAREVQEWLHRSLIATPLFLSRCAAHGERVTVDRLPYLMGEPHIELGSDIRVSGLITIRASGQAGAPPRLRIGNGVFIGHGTSFNLAESIEVGDYASIGAGTYVADTEGHFNYNPNRPIWEVGASSADVAKVVIEENVQISRECMILKGVRIGARSIIGARSVVRSDIPPDSVVMGNPARVVKRMNPGDAVAAVPVAGR